jgi:tetratricopeptide (TPR) repeat protein
MRNDMMTDVGLNSDVLAGGKNFHIQTTFLEPVDKIVSNIFDNGKVILKKELLLKNGLSKSNINVKEVTEGFHKEMVAEIELLYYISDKVKTIKHASSNNKLGVVFLKKNLFDEAIREFMTAIELDSEYVDAYKNLGIAYSRTKEYEKAVEIVKKGLEKQSDYADLFNTLGDIYLDQNQFEEAIAAFNKALEINPTYAETNLNLGITYLKSVVVKDENDKLPTFDVRKDIAIKHLQKAESFINSDKLIEAYQYFDEGELVKSLKILESARRERFNDLNSDFENEFYLKFMFGGKGKDDTFIVENINKLKEAIKKNPKYPDLRNNLGVAYLIQCRNLFLNALDEFRHALKLNPNFKKAEKNLKLAENDGKGFLILLRAILK